MVKKAKFGREFCGNWKIDLAAKCGEKKVKVSFNDREFQTFFPIPRVFFCILRDINV